jgi:3-deoxy-manno-octulosonate cytidylyltransferase (CMP-KDO synthetase)
MQSLIVIPARYGSKRLPGKPLRSIAGKSLLTRVWDVAEQASELLPGTEVVVATDDQRIVDHCSAIGANCVMTAEACRTGSDRAYEAVTALGAKPDVVVNFQGDSPFTPPETIVKVIQEFENNPDISVVTPAVELSWHTLDKFRQNKATSPFSGTTVVLDPNKNALWFSKQIIPAIRKEDDLRSANSASPVYRHMGLYAYRYQALKEYSELPTSNYEKLEGLEQLRFLENGYRIRAIILDLEGQPSMSGIDSEEDIARAEALLAEHGVS